MPKKLTKADQLILEEGATRTNDVLVDHSLIPQVVNDTLAARLTLGKASHGRDNWKNGGRDFILSCFARYENHKSRMLYNPGQDDDLSAMLCNVAFLVWFRKNKPKQFAEALEMMK